jgi:hypothetical protein
MMFFYLLFIQGKIRRKIGIPRSRWKDNITMNIKEIG